MKDRAYAKINLSLDVFNIREDGYHDLCSIMVPIDFYDELEESLILADLGVDTATKATERLRKAIREQHLKTPEEAKAALKDILEEIDHTVMMYYLKLKNLHSMMLLTLYALRIMARISLH